MVKQTRHYVALIGSELKNDFHTRKLLKEQTIFEIFSSSTMSSMNIRFCNLIFGKE